MTVTEQRNKHYWAIQRLFDLPTMSISVMHRRLRRIESQLNLAAIQWNNGEITEKRYDDQTKLVAAQLQRFFKKKTLPLIFDGDGRGYAIKLDHDWMKQNDTTGIYTDMNGYGILAPDFSE